MIDSYSFGRIVIDGEKYTDDVIIFPDRVRDGWYRREGHRLHPEDIEDVLEASPDVLVVGTGAHGRMTVPPETRKRVELAGIKLIVERSEEACETFNELEGSNEAVAALHLTC